MRDDLALKIDDQMFLSFALFVIPFRLTCINYVNA
jgi:hypothetical protein